MGCHFCADEMFAIFAILGGVKFLPGWVRAMWSRRHAKPTCQHDHSHEPVEPMNFDDLEGR